MDFRTRTDLPCPRCGIPLERYSGERDKWRCKQCVGVLLAEGELAVEAPWLLEEPARDATGPQPKCPVCQTQMAPIGYEQVELDRCDADKVVWFDAAELGLVLELAHAEMDREAELTKIEGQRPLTLISRVLSDDPATEADKKA